MISHEISERDKVRGERRRAQRGGYRTAGSVVGRTVEVVNR